MNIENIVAIVTGAGRKGRLGHAIAIALAERGAHILVHYHSSKEGAEDVAHEIKKLGVRVAICQADMVDDLVGEKLVGIATKELGASPQILINTAAPFPKDSISDFYADEFSSTMRSIALGPALTMHAMVKALPNGKEGAIVNLIDVRIGNRPYADRLSYGAAKAALREITFAAAVELAPRGIRVNSISPGAALQATGMDKKHHENVLEKVPLGREAGADAIAQAVVFLIEHGYSTGVDFPVDGGAHLV